MQFPGYRILIFARAPVPGRCKSRLIPALGEAGAARVAESLLRHVMEEVRSARLAPAVLCCSPDAGHPAFSEWGVPLWRQQGVTLGDRMRHAARRALLEAERVLLIGSDCPGISAGYLRAAFAALDGADVALGPAEDGGYVLLGMRRFDGALFRDIDWGTGRVLAQTRQRIDDLGWSCGLLGPRRDVDRPEDLEWLRNDYPAIFSG